MPLPSPEDLGRARAAIEEKQRRTLDGVSLVRSLIRDGGGNGPNLSDLVEGWIDAAALRGLIRLNGDGFAIANDPAQADPDDIPSDHPDRVEEYRRRLKLTSTIAFADDGTLNEQIGDVREVEALRMLLKLGHAQTYAQAVLGAEMTDVPMLLDLAVMGLDPAVTCVANRTFRGVARSTLTAVHDLLESEAKRQTELPTWQGALLLAMMRLTSEKRGQDAVDFVLSTMETLGGEPHGNFRLRAKKHTKEAIRVLRAREDPAGGYRITYKQKPGKGWVRPWGAAREFALAFGIELPRESAAKRDRTAERKR